MCPFCNSEKLLIPEKRCKLTILPVSIEQRDDVCCNGTMFQCCAYYLAREIPSPKDKIVEPRQQLLQIYFEVRPSVREKLDETFTNCDGFIAAMFERYHEYAPNIAADLLKVPMEANDPIVAVSIKDGVIFDYFKDFLLFPWSGTHPRKGSLNDILCIKVKSKPARKRASYEADDWDNIEAV